MSREGSGRQMVMQMKAMVITRYGSPRDALRPKEVPKPSPKEDEVLVKVHAVSVNTSNLVIIQGRPFLTRLIFGLFRPGIRIPGNDIAGRVVAAGRNVTKFAAGDSVFGDLSGCGRGGFAEYVCAPETALAKKPANISFEEASAVPEAALVALQGLRDHGKIQKGHKVLIYGASGGIGTFAVQIAKYSGAEVTGVCSTPNMDLVRSLGADHVIDYTRGDFTKNGQQYDLIFITAYHPIARCMDALCPQGTCVSTGGPSLRWIFQDMILGPVLSGRNGKNYSGGWLVEMNRDLDFMRDLIEAGHVRPVIDRCCPFDRTPEAFAYYAKKHARGKVVVTVAEDTSG